MNKPSYYINNLLKKFPKIPERKELIAQTLAFYKQAKETGSVYFWIVYAISIYTPFEEFVLKWLPGSTVAAAARFITEAILIVMFTRMVYLKVFRGGTFKRTPIDPLVIAFIISALISTVINKSSPVSLISYLRILFRYLTVYYIVVNIDISPERLSKLMNGVRVTGLIQGTLASIQYFAPGGFNKIFAPKEIWLGGQAARSTVASSGGLKAGSVAGTFSDSAVLSAFLLIAIIMVLAHIYKRSNVLVPSRKDLIHIILVFFGLFASKKRAGLMISFIIPILIFWYLKRHKNLIKLTWLYTSLSLLLAVVLMSGVLNTTTDIGGNTRGDEGESVDATSYLTQIFSPDYWAQSSDNSRIWFIRVVGGSTLQHATWFGFGPQLARTQNTLSDLQENPDFQQRLEESTGFFEDVYWFAFMAFFGVCGLALYYLINVRLYCCAKWLIKNSSDPQSKSLGAIFCTLVVITFIYCFIERILKLRPFAFYFWLLAGLVVNVRNSKLEEAQKPVRQLNSQ